MRDRMGCLNSIFKIWPDKICTTGEKNTGRKGRLGSFQVKQNHTGLIVSADDIILSTEPGVSDNSQAFSGGNFGSGCMWGRFWDGRVESIQLISI